MYLDFSSSCRVDYQITNIAYVDLEDFLTALYCIVYNSNSDYSSLLDSWTWTKCIYLSEICILFSRRRLNRMPLIRTWVFPSTINRIININVNGRIIVSKLPSKAESEPVAFPRHLAVRSDYSRLSS